jgi:hypothetical protein
MPESTSDYAEEGRLAHTIAELKLRKRFVEPIGPRKFTNQIKKFKEQPLFDPEMLKLTEDYLDYVSGIAMSYDIPPHVAVEKRLNYSDYAPDGFGTGDCIIIGGNTLHVIDFKYGKGVPVVAENNPQIMLYALGALTEYSILFNIESVKMTIFQPRLSNVAESEMSADALLAWGKSIQPTAEKAFRGLGEFKPGDHCRFCRARSRCRARSEFNTDLEDQYHLMKPPLLSNEEVGAILQRAKNLAAWVSDLEKYGLAECLAGNEIPGWKAVEGRSKRGFTDQEAAFALLQQNGIEETMLYERTPLTLAAVEKLLGKAKFRELLSGYVETPPGKPTLAPESDKREAVTRTSASEDFGNAEGGNAGEVDRAASGMA